MHKIVSVVLVLYGVFHLSSPCLESPLWAQDCNVNDVPDGDDIALGQSEDCNGNGIPDECEFAPVELALSGTSLGLAGVPRKLLIADLNGDEVGDFISANIGAPGWSLTVVVSKGEGEYDEVVEYAAGEVVRDFVAADLDGDGDIDIATADATQLLFFENSGEGRLEAPVQVASPVSPFLIEAADLSGDGVADLLATASGGASIHVFESLGDGRFGAPTTIALPGGVKSMLAADFDDDGDEDLALIWGRLRNTFGVLENTGDGALALLWSASAGNSNASLSAGDLSGDGRLDVIGTDSSGLHVWIAEATGGFAPKVTYRESGSIFTTGDIDGDGDLDLAVGAGSKIGLWINRGSGGLVPVRRFDVDAVDFRMTDFDSDGDLDIAALVDKPPALSFLENGSTVALSLDVTDYPADGQPHGLALADFDDDGHLDVVSGNCGNDSFSFLFGRGDGSLESPFRRFFGDLPFCAVTVSDLNQDGRPDVSFRVDDRILGVGNAVAVLYNDGGRSIVERELTLFPSPGMGRTIDTADVTGDGFPDVFTVDEAGGAVNIHFNDGEGGLTEFQRFQVGAAVAGVDHGDIDGDENVDVLTANRGSSSISLLFNRGDRVFDAPISLPVSGAPGDVVTFDFNGDGSLDIASANGASDDVAVLLNRGDGSFAAPVRHATAGGPFELLTVDLDSDGITDMVTTNVFDGSISFLKGLGDATFRRAQSFKVEDNPRQSDAGDLDHNGRVDLVVANRVGRSVSVVLNKEIDAGADVDFLEDLCTERDFVDISIAGREDSLIDRSLKYTTPVRDDETLLQTVYQNVRRHALHQEFLREVFPERFPGLSVDEYNNLVSFRASRTYYVGVINRIRRGDGIAYGFTALVDTTDPSELLNQEEVTAIYERLLTSFSLEPLGYFPRTNLEREVAESWTNPTFPIYFDTGPERDYLPYTRAVGFGRLLLLDREAFAAANDQGSISFQNILVLDFAPRDIEGVVGGVITAEEQGELSHLSVRTARRGSPNAFVKEAVAAFAPFRDKLVRLEVREAEYRIREATLEEAQEFWESSRPSLSEPPAFDPDFAEFLSLNEIAVLENDPGNQVVRFGGKATNLARLQRILDAPEWAEYQERGFAIPMRYYLEFLRSNELPSALDPGRSVTYEAYLEELFADPEFQSNSELRFDRLDDLRDHMRDEGRVDPALIQSLVTRIGEVMGTPTDVRVRFRSSSNIEDGLEFNGAGLYDSTSGCLQDDLDADGAGPSWCDPTRDTERGVTRALKQVWRSLWNFRAFEEREFFQIDQCLSAMAVLVNRTFIGEVANGVAFTGSPSNLFDKRYVITVQVGEESVVSPEPGIRAEKDVLTVEDGQVVDILRATTSSLVPPGNVVLTNAQLEELGALLWHVDQNFPLELGDHSREEVVLDFEFKIMPDGELAVKQVRPFLISAPPLPTPTFELEIPQDTVICGTFQLGGTGRGPAEEYAWKTQLRLSAGTMELTTRGDSFRASLVDELRFGPNQELATPVEDEGLFELRRDPGDDGITRYEFKFSQDFALSDGTQLELEIVSPLTYRAREDEALGGPIVLDDRFFTRVPTLESFQLRIDGASLVAYGSCSYETLPLIEIRATAEDGIRLAFLERFEQGFVDGLETSPVTIVSADVDFGAAGTRSVDDYWRLVYSAEQHNVSTTYWAVFDTPLSLPGVAGAVHAVELFDPNDPDNPDPEKNQALITYLGADLEPLGSAVLITELTRSEVSDTRFVRGDVQDDGAINLADAQFLLNYLFLRGDALPCRKAADANDDGVLNLVDALRILLAVFREPGTIPDPGPGCGSDPSPDDLGCETQQSCP